MTRMVFIFFACCSPTAVGMRQQSAAWDGGELHDSKESHSLNDFLFMQPFDVKMLRENPPR